MAKFGVPPERIVDYLALVGDSGRQCAGRRQGRAQDGGEMAHAIRHAGRRDRQRRQKSAARSARTCARRSTGCRRGRADHRQDRLRPVGAHIVDSGIAVAKGRGQGGDDRVFCAQRLQILAARTGRGVRCRAARHAPASAAAGCAADAGRCSAHAAPAPADDALRDRADRSATGPMAGDDRRRGLDVGRYRDHLAGADAGAAGRHFTVLRAGHRRLHSGRASLPGRAAAAVARIRIE